MQNLNSSDATSDTPPNTAARPTTIWDVSNDTLAAGDHSGILKLTLFLYPIHVSLERQ